jgi:molybdate transport system permease protein
VAGNIPGRTQTMPLAVYDAVQRSDYDRANQIGLTMVAIGYATIWLTRRLAEGGGTP